jgi:hypothetical protein
MVNSALCSSEQVLTFGPIRAGDNIFIATTQRVLIKRTLLLRAVNQYVVH